MSVAEIFSSYLKTGLFTHAYCARGKLSRDTPEYEYVYSPDRRTIFDLASMTKALVTTPLIFSLAEKIKKPISASVGEWLNGKDHHLHKNLLAIKISDLLTHTSGLPAWRNFWVCKLGVLPDSDLANSDHRESLIVEGLNRLAPLLSTTKSDVYSDVGFILLGYVIEQVAAMDLAHLFSYFIEDLLNNKTSKLVFGPQIIEKSNVVPTAICSVRCRQLIGEVHDENCAAFGGIAGHAGLFGTGRDVASYLHSLIQMPVGQELLRVNANKRVLPVKEPPNASLMGWRQGADPSSFPFGNGASIGHMGFTGVAFWVWPEKQEYVILLTNRVISGRNSPGIAQMRRDIFTELAAM